MAGTAIPLPGVTPPAQGLLPEGIAKLKQLGGDGAGRVLLTAVGREESEIDLEATLVHEFTHVNYVTEDIGFFLGGKGVPASTSEGGARIVESYFRAIPQDPADVVGPIDAIAQLPGLAGHAAQFDGAVPNDKQIYGASADADYYYDLAASAFLSITGDPRFQLQSLGDAYINGGDPFSGIVEDTKGGVVTYADPDVYRSDWAERIRKYL